MNEPQSTQPYGAPAPAFAPYTPKPPGATSAKAWGIILILLGAILALQWLVGLASLGGGFTGSEFAIGVDEEVKRETDAMAAKLIADQKARWTFWAFQLTELVVVGLTLAAGIFLAVKPRPLGRNLAIARAILVLVALPLTGYEGMMTIEQAMTMQQASMKSTFDKQLEAEVRANPKMSEAEKARRRAELESISDTMGPMLKGVTYGAVVVTVVISLIINTIILIFMTRPGLKAYLETAADQGNIIHGYDPSMGMIGPPPGPPPPV